MSLIVELHEVDKTCRSIGSYTMHELPDPKTQVAVLSGNSEYQWYYIDSVVLVATNSSDQGAPVAILKVRTLTGP